MGRSPPPHKGVQTNMRVLHGIGLWLKLEVRDPSRAASIHESILVKIFDVSIAEPESDLTFFWIFELGKTSFSNLA